MRLGRPSADEKTKSNQGRPSVHGPAYLCATRAVWKPERSGLISLRPADKLDQTSIVFDLLGDNQLAVYETAIDG